MSTDMLRRRRHFPIVSLLGTNP